MKKHLQALRRLEDDLARHDLLTPALSGALEQVKSSASQLPEASKTQDGQLPPPAELKDQPLGLALYADGACRGNPGPGAWGCVAQNAEGEILFEAAGFEETTTNNRMEIMGAIQALQLLENHLMENPLVGSGHIGFYTDSKYVVDGINQWVKGWKARGWKKADGKAPENMDLWLTLDEWKAKFPQVHVAWVRGHNGHPQNEFCDRLANRVLDSESV